MKSNLAPRYQLIITAQPTAASRIVMIEEGSGRVVPDAQWICWQTDLAAKIKEIVAENAVVNGIVAGPQKYVKKIVESLNQENIIPILNANEMEL